MRFFAGKSALVTGAASGIGLATAIRLAESGALVTCIDRNAARLDRVAPPGSIKLAIDVAIPASWKRLTGRFDHVVLSAGVAGAGPVAELDFAEWRRIMAVNLDGTFLALQAALRRIDRAGGSVVVVASASGIKVEPETAAYGASKAAVLHLVRVAAREQAARGVRVNAIAPAGVETPMWSDQPFFRDMVSELGSEAAAYAALAAQATPLGRFASADEIAAQILFLLSDEAATITGATLTSDGGYLL